MIRVSLVLAVYDGESALNFQECLNSISSQSHLPDEVIVVRDGVLNPDLNQVIFDFKMGAKMPVIDVALDKNSGAAAARNFGVRFSAFDYVAFMDSDDVMSPFRLERQVDFLSKNKNVGALFSLTQEFEGCLEEPGQIKYSPEFHFQIVKDLRFSCCLANPTLILLKSAFLNAGGYAGFRYVNEDYLLYLRLISKGVTLHCLQDVLLFVRNSPGQKRRRVGWRLLKEDFRFRFECFKEGHLGLFYCFLSVFLLAIRRLSPLCVSNFLQKCWRKIQARRSN